MFISLFCKMIKFSGLDIGLQLFVPRTSDKFLEPPGKFSKLD